MLRYAHNEEQCRSRVLEAYFGAGESQPCGQCDLCLARRRAEKQSQPQDEALTQQLLTRLEAQPLDPHALAEELACPPETIARIIRSLTSRGEICIDDEGRLKIQRR
jgi:ATP-dependent DNA helicase RecQ